MPDSCRLLCSCCCMVLSLASAAASDAIPREDIISYWTCASRESGLRQDEIGSNHLIGSAASQIIVGKVDEATALLGSNRLHTRNRTDTHSSSLSSVGQDITWAGWFRLEHGDVDQTLVARWDRWSPGRDFRCYYRAKSQDLALIWAGHRNESRVSLAAPQTIEPGVWYLLAFGHEESSNQLWISVSKETQATISERSTMEAASNARGQSGQIGFGFHDEKAAPMTGALDEWAAYRSSLSDAALAWLFNAGAGRRLEEYQYLTPPRVEYFHDFEQDEPLRGRFCYQSLNKSMEFSTEQAAAGKRSLKAFSAWGQIQVFNNSNTDYWCSTGECKVSMDLYVERFHGGSMLFQVDGKVGDRIADFDTNEGIAMRFKTDNGRRTFRGVGDTGNFNLPLSQWLHVVYLFRRNPDEGQPAIECYVDGQRISATYGNHNPVVTRAWHHISIGNDTNSDPIFYLDNFAIAPVARLNDPPVVEAGAGLRGTVGQATQCSARIYDLDADALSIQWLQVEGPAPAQIETADAAATAITCSAAGNYVFEIQVSDGQERSSDRLSLNIAAQ